MVRVQVWLPTLKETLDTIREMRDAHSHKAGVSIVAGVGEVDGFVVDRIVRIEATGCGILDSRLASVQHGPTVHVEEENNRLTYGSEVHGDIGRLSVCVCDMGDIGSVGSLRERMFYRSPTRIGSPAARGRVFGVFAPKLSPVSLSTHTVGAVENARLASAALASCSQVPQIGAADDAVDHLDGAQNLLCLQPLDEGLEGGELEVPELDSHRVVPYDGLAVQHGLARRARQ